MGFIQMKSA